MDRGVDLPLEFAQHLGSTAGHLALGTAGVVVK